MSKLDDRAVTGLSRNKPKEVKQSPLTTPAFKIQSNDIAIIERRYKVMELRRDGYTVRDIASIVGCSSTTVTADIKGSLAEVLNEHALTTEEERAIQVERLDNLIRAYTPLATENIYEKVIDGRSGKEIIVASKPDPAFANLILQCETRRAKLLALDVPEQKKLEVTAIREYRGINVDDV